MSVIYPTKAPDLKDIRGPLIFFGGPDQGGGGWREIAYDLFAEYYGDNFCAAMPCVYPDSHRFAKLRLPPAEIDKRRRYTRLDWIEYYADMAAIHRPRGCALYWLPLESKTGPRADGMSYATKSLFEIGLLLGRRMYEQDRMRYVLGIEPGFPERNALIANYKKRLRHFEVYESLEDTVKSAVKRMGQDNWNC